VYRAVLPHIGASSATHATLELFSGFKVKVKEMEREHIQNARKNTLNM
jgi:hypothetical protein